MPAADDLEVELKLEASPADLDRLAAAPILADTAFVDRPQVSTYFDAAEQELRKAGLSLRVRRIGDRFVQTVKAEGSSAAGLFARPEWECDIADGTPVIDDAAAPLATLVRPAVLNTLAPAFTVEVTRRTALVVHDDAEIEVVIDRGTITAGDRTAAVAEIELELKHGAPAALFSLARAMGAVVPLRIGVLAKSERGYRLLDGRGDKAVKAKPGVLAGEMTAGEAFRRIAADCLRQFRLNEALFERTQSAGAVHQARVAIRRLRSALSIFKPMLGSDDRFEHFRAELRWLAGALGDLRDIDVLLVRLPAHDEQLRTAREAAVAGVAEALASHRACTLMIELSEWIAIGAWRSDHGDPAIRDRAAARFAGETLDTLRRRIKRRGRDLDRLSDEQRHDVRILAKKLRYAADFFAGLFTGKKATRRTAPFLAALEKVQQHLGDLNDIAHGPSVLARLGIPPAEQDDDAARREALIAKAADAHETLADAKPFWR